MHGRKLNKKGASTLNKAQHLFNPSQNVAQIEQEFNNNSALSN